METRSNVETVINRDCSLIVEAIRRLKDGTWRLDDEDSEWADHLLPIIQEALIDHIEYENACLLPNLPRDSAQEHLSEHARMLALLWSLDQSRTARKFDFFRAHLDSLMILLDGHHEKFGCQTPSSERCNDDCVRNKILKRAEGSTLECR